MNLSGIPVRFQKIWAQDASGPYIRTVPVNAPVQDGAASFDLGFPPDNFSPITAGGVPPFGQDVNGALNVITAWQQWEQAGGPVYYDATFATAVGGYPQGAVLPSAIVVGKYWVSTVDANLTDPDSSSSSGWINLPGTMDTGDLKPAINTNLPAGFVPGISSYTIGSAASVANYAAADAIFLYIWFWTWFSNVQCPVSGGRGANARADFAANKTIQVFDMSASVFVGNDNSTGRLSGVPVVSGGINSNGSIIGEPLHTLITSELAAHVHANSLIDPMHTHTNSNNTNSANSASSTGGGGFTLPSTVAGTITINAASTGVTITNASQGGGGAHNNTQRAAVGTWLFRL